ncbi:MULTISPECIES: hypothetical protein [Streptomyces]|uniref:Secreted protein n=2 Tax=Streptomyces TaxID=1883 RepID=A0A1E7M2H7_9ACTN|nr:hypothetical protein [Streptomyces nanshensis]OEV22303.1 hypothetical protein AN221_01150 [Streptomyces nanshensis]
MSDDAEITSAAPEASTTPEASAAPEPAAPEPSAPKRRRAVATVLPLVLVLAAVGGAAAYTAQAVNGADRTVETAVWDGSAPEPGPDPAAKADRGRADTELSRLLLPVPEGYRLGPDLAGLSNDGEASGEAAVAALKEEGGRGLSAKQYRQLDALIGKLKVRGVAHRSYAADSGDLVLSVRVTQAEDARTVRTLHEQKTALVEAFGVLDKGPKIDGHKNATCYRLPDDRDNPVDSIACYAYEGGTSVTFQVDGPKPLRAATVAGLVKQQLDHITSPGMSV